MSADIIAGESIGGISLGDNVLDILEAAGDKFAIKEIPFENFGNKYFHYKLNDGEINFTSNYDGEILAIWCEPGYLGMYNGYLYPGISAREIKEVSKIQEIYKGFLVIDRNFNVYYDLNEGVDDFDRFEDVNDEVKFNALYVGDLKK